MRWGLAMRHFNIRAGLSDDPPEPRLYRSAQQYGCMIGLVDSAANADGQPEQPGKRLLAVISK